MGTPPINTDTTVMLATPAPIQIARYARNKLIPSAELEARLTSSLNAAAAARRKELFRWHGDLLNIPSGSGTARVRWRFAGHTGVNLRRLKATVVMARHNVSLGAGDAPTSTLYITNADESTTYASASASYGASSTNPSDVPSEWGVFSLDLNGVPADTDIFGRFEDSGGGRLISAVVHEEGKKLTTANGYVMPASVSVGSPIYDDRRATAYELATALHNSNAASLWPFTVDDQSSPLVTASSTWTNIIDSSTSVSASSAGATLDLRYCKTRSTSSVPCVLAIYGSLESSGAGISGDVRILDSDGTDIATVSVTSTTAGWVTTTVDMPDTLDKFDLQYRSADNLNSFNLGAASLFQYAA